jgi:ribosomal-protein-alanine N-acetyltransferase
MSPGTSIRHAVIADAAVLLEIERACAEAPHWTERVWAKVFADRPPDGSLDSLDGLQRLCLVATRSGEVAGFIVIGVAGIGGIGGGFAEIESLAVRQAERRCGVGRSLCLQAMLQAQTMGAQQMQLEVRSASVAALGLYRSLGFVEKGRRAGYYRDPPDDAVLMCLALR